MSCDAEWEKFLNDETDIFNVTEKENNNVIVEPSCTDLYVSTKTLISFLNKPIDLKKTFWAINVINYMTPKEGVIKKQIKYVFDDKEEISFVKNKYLKNEKIVRQQKIKSIDDGVTFKEVQKISIGLCKKDLINQRRKQSSAFYNCFALILRIKIDGRFKECHVKLFNTGKLELPGIQSEEHLNKILTIIIDTLNLDITSNQTQNEPYFVKPNFETVLINSNFKTNFNIDRCKVEKIFNNKYNITTSYDPSSYQGTMSKFYYDHTKSIQTGVDPGYSIEDTKHSIQNKTLTMMSFMIFRTGSILIVGKCEEYILYEIYEIIKNILITNYEELYQIVEEQPKYKSKKKNRKKTIIINPKNT